MVNFSWWRTNFEREDWFLLASTFFVWLDVFPCVLNALLPYSQALIPYSQVFLWHIMQQKLFPLALKPSSKVKNKETLNATFGE